MNENIISLVGNIEKVILGKRSVIVKIVSAMLCGGHVLIEDVPGVGKTKLVAALAKSLNGKFNRIQFTPDIMPTDITGFTMIDPTTKEFVFRNGMAMCNFLLADEINRASPKVQSALLEVMEEKQVSIDGKTHKLPRPFMTFATQNPIENFGTYHLPEAQMDRFAIKISMGYLEPADEVKLLDNIDNQVDLHSIQPIFSIEDVLNLQAQAQKTSVHPLIKEYIISIITATRNNENVKLGASPRGSIDLFNLSKSVAFIMGRSFVTPDDVLLSAPMTLPHRIILSPKGKGTYQTSENFVKEIMKATPIPNVDGLN